nr:DNA polymerase sliding clamp [uncultured Methanoregula sp.]
MMKIPQQRLSALCDTLAALVPECKLMITADGLNTLAVDTANVGMVQVNLPKEQFDEYTETAKVEIGMDVPKWVAMLKIMNDSKSTIEIQLNDNKVRISDGKYTYTFTLLDPNTVRKRPNPPNITLPAHVVVNAKEFAEAIKAMGVVGDKCRLTALHDGEVLELSAEGETDTLRKELNVPVPGTAKKEPVSSLFSLDYLSDISKAMKDAGKITVCLGQDHPVRFDFELEGIESSFLVAPRIEDKE